MQHWELKIKLEVADSWVTDGFNAKERVEEIQDLISGLLPYAYGHEIKVAVQIVREPDQEIIYQLQNGELEAKD